MGIALDTPGAQLYVADYGNNAVQVLDLGNNQTETFLDASAGILKPVDVALDSGNNVYVLNEGTIAVSDAGNHVIWQVNPVTQAVTLLTGKLGVPGTTLGSASFAKLNQ